MTGSHETDYTENLEKAARFIRENDYFLVASHVHPDGDAISSTCAVAWILDQCGKSYTLANEDAIPDKFLFLRKADEIKPAKDVTHGSFAFAICVDCGDLARVGDTLADVVRSAQILNIDHHATNDLYGARNLVHARASSTTQVLFDLIMHMNLEWTEEIAELIYTGLLTDTGGFRYANTTPETMNIASRLLQMGVQANKLNERLLETISLAHVQLLKRALQSLELSDDRRIAWLIVRKEDIEAAGAGNEDTDGIVNYARNIEGVEVGVFFRQVEENKYKVSFRAAGDVNVSRIAQQFGGGGHVQAAGATVSGSLADVVHRVISAVKAALA